MKKKITLKIGDAVHQTDLPATSAPRSSNGGTKKAKGKIFALLRDQAGIRPISLKACLDLVSQLGLDEQTAKRCRAYIHGIQRGDRGLLTNLRGLLNREESAIKTRGRRSAVLRKSDAALPQSFHGRTPNLQAKTYRANPTRKPGGHKS